MKICPSAPYHENMTNIGPVIVEVEMKCIGYVKEPRIDIYKQCYI